MVITRLIGGLGNQLFQYASARRIAHLSGVPLRLDLSEFETYELHRYSLAPFNLAAQPASPQELRPYRRTLVSRFSRRVQQHLPVRWRRYLVEPHFHFAPEMLKARGSVYMIGYWQSEKYFADIAPLIREEVRVTRAPSGLNAELAARIMGCVSVSMHVRRGDYVGHATHPVCSPDYYRAAMSRMRETLGDCQFFLFSDDVEWAAHHFAGHPDIAIVDHNGPDRNHEDFRLMTLCRHHIIANSTYSWWPAWLSDGPDTIVIAPRQWFRGDRLDARDLIPDRWVRL